MKEIYKNKLNLLVGLTFAGAVLLVLIILPNYQIVINSILSPKYSLGLKLKLWQGLAGGFFTNYTGWGRLALGVLAVLSGVNVMIFIYYLRNKYRLLKMTGLNLLGIAAGMLGIGCASCGSIVITSLLGLGLSGAIISRLPLNGNEIMISGMAIMLGSTIYLWRQVGKPMSCALGARKR